MGKGKRTLQNRLNIPTNIKTRRPQTMEPILISKARVGNCLGWQIVRSFGFGPIWFVKPLGEKTGAPAVAGHSEIQKISSVSTPCHFCKKHKNNIHPAHAHLPTGKFELHPAESPPLNLYIQTSALTTAPRLCRDCPHPSIRCSQLKSGRNFKKTKY